MHIAVGKFDNQSQVMMHASAFPTFSVSSFHHLYARYTMVLLVVSSPPVSWLAHAYQEWKTTPNHIAIQAQQGLQVGSWSEKMRQCHFWFMSSCFNFRNSISFLGNLSLFSLRLYETTKWSEIIGSWAQTLSRIFSSSRVIKRSNVGPARCVGTDTCWVRLNISSSSRKSDALLFPLSSTWKLKSPTIKSFDRSVV